MNQEKIKLAFIGNGKSTNRYHLPYLDTLRDKFDVKTIWKHSEKESPWDSFEGANYTLELSDILDDNEIDLVVITTPANTHYELTKKVLEAGKNAVVEKPFTMTSEEAKELFKLANDKGLILMSYQNRRFDSDFLTVQKVIESGKLGDIFEIESNYDYYRPEVSEGIKEYKKENSFVYSHACHSVDQIISYFGLPNDIKFDVKQILGPNRNNDYFDIDLYYGDLKVSVRSSYFRLKSRPGFLVYGTKGTFIKETEDRQEADLKKFYMPNNTDFGMDRLEDYGTLYYIDDDGNYHEEKVISEKGNYALFYEELYKTLKNGKKPLVKEEEIIRQIEILEEMTEDLK